jgi:hypothetical protein
VRHAMDGPSAFVSRSIRLRHMYMQVQLPRGSVPMRLSRARSATRRWIGRLRRTLFRNVLGGPARLRPACHRLAVLSRAASIRIFVFALPIVFVVTSWFAGAGFPYYHDNNETFLVYVEARNLELWNPSEYSWLAATATDPTLPHAEHVYTHMPNGPRYLHYLLLRAGVRDLRYQTLLLSLTATILTVVLLWRVFNCSALSVVPLAIVLDYSGFLAWTINTYRVWIFALYFGMVLAVDRRRLFWVGVTAFAAFQADVGVALFVCTAGAAHALLAHRHRATLLILALAVGTFLSAGIFGIQVLSYYGWDGFMSELTATYARRGTNDAHMTIWTYLLHTWLGLLMLVSGVASEMYNPFVGVILYCGMIAAPWLLVRGRLTGPRRFLAVLSVSTTFGAIATSTLLHGYFVDAFVASQLPFATLLIAPSTGLVALELRRRLAACCPWKGLGAVCGAAVLLPLVASSVSHYRPPVVPDLIRLLATDYQNRSIVGPGITAEFAFAMTGGRSASIGGLGTSAGFPAVAADLERLRSMNDLDSPLLFLCLEPMYRGHATNPLFAACQDIVTDMAPRMRDTVASGRGWMLVRLDPETAVVTDTKHQP